MDVPTSKIGGKECVAIVAKHPFSWSILLIMGVQFGCAPCQGGALQWVQIPPGKRSSRKQPEQLWR
jgi:hypothetical protein